MSAPAYEMEWSAQDGGFVRTPRGTTTLGVSPSWLMAATLSVSAVDTDGTRPIGSIVVSHEEERDLSDSEKASIVAMWADNESLHGPTPIHAINQDGTYAGQVTSLSAGQQEVPSAPPASDGYAWDGNQWIVVINLDELKETLQCNIDRAAGAARSKYITVAAGQDATYIVKEQQAQAFLADPTGPVPSYIQAEANATGMTPLEAATLIDNTAQAWAVLGPEIEQARRAGNLAVIGAATPADAMTAYQSALTALNAV